LACTEILILNNWSWDVDINAMPKVNCSTQSYSALFPKEKERRDGRRKSNEEVKNEIERETERERDKRRDRKKGKKRDGTRT
jgi:hypothetical protein